MSRSACCKAECERNNTRTGARVGTGCFTGVNDSVEGAVWCGAGVHIGTGEEVAIKLESVRSKHPQLLYESKVLRYLKGGVGLPEGLPLLSLSTPPIACFLSLARSLARCSLSITVQLNRGQQS